jgi:hypothetical protein
LVGFNENKIGYSRELGNKFWYEYDYPFNSTFRDIGNDMKYLLNISSNIYSRYRQNYDRTSLKLNEISFKNSIKEMFADEEILRLANIQSKIIHDNFVDKKDLEKAFEDFGQGILYDVFHDNERTARDRDGNPIYYPVNGNLMRFRIHKMDSKVMWKWWHSFMRGTALIYPNEIRYFEIDRLIAYAYIIDFIVKPKQYYEFVNGEIPKNHPQNPCGPGSPEAVREAKFILSAEKFKELDKIFEDVW